MVETTVIIVGAGPSGLSIAACLSHSSIPYIILEREDCFASLWKKYAYDRLHIHLRKQYCQLPLMDLPSSAPTYMPKAIFLKYLDDYVLRFGINPLYERNVEMAEFDEIEKKWRVRARNGSRDKEMVVEEYVGWFLVVATGETTDAFVPEVEGIGSFNGEVLHSTKFKSGKVFEKKKVLVVGAGNSGLEIALDLVNHGAETSIVVRSPVNVMTRGMVYMALVLSKHLSVGIVDSIMVILSKLIYGDLSKYGIRRPEDGPMLTKVKYGKYPAIDVGTFDKIKSGEIQVLPAEISNIVQGNNVVLKNGKSYQFDSIIFCTGFKRSTNLWLKGDEYLLNDDGLPKHSYPNDWKGKNGLYCVGLSRGLYGANSDAQNIAKDVSTQIHQCV